MRFAKQSAMYLKSSLAQTRSDVNKDAHNDLKVYQ